MRSESIILELKEIYAKNKIELSIESTFNWFWRYSIVLRSIIDVGI